MLAQCTLSRARNIDQAVEWTRGRHHPVNREGDASPMVMPLDLITDDERDELREQGFGDEVAAIDRRARDARDREYPEPDAQDILEIFDELQEQWHDWRHGSSVAIGDADDARRVATGMPGVLRIRDMRYHRDTMPKAWFDRLNVPYRYRTHLTANEMARTVALATRNIPRVTVPASSDDARDATAADKERRAMQALIPALERQAERPLIRQVADGLFEGGMAFFELFLRGVYDDLDLDQREDEDDDAYMKRTDEAMLAASKRDGLPIGVRVPDPVSVYPDFDDEGLCEVLIVEDRPYRRVWNRLHRKLGFDKLTELRLPKPGKGVTIPHDYRVGAAGGTDVRCIRYYNRYWYVYLVGDRIVEMRPHGFPRIPVIVAFGDVTSSSVIAEAIQGVVGGMVEQEQAINDYITTKLDIAHTYGRPKPVIERTIDAPGDTPPATVDLSKPNVATRLMRGESVKDAYQSFNDRMSDPLLGSMLSIRGGSGINPISAGESPGADPSGFAINSLQAANQMRYEILLDNLARAIGMFLDLIRMSVKDGVIADRLFIPVETARGEFDYIGLGPEDISDMPCQVVIDPMNDVNRLAIQGSLINANKSGYLPRRIVQEQGFGAENARAWDNEIAEDMADVQLMGMAFEEAKMRIYGAGQGVPSGLVDKNGNPISSQDRPNPGGGGAGQPSAEDGSEPAPPRGSSVGREVAAASRGGQQPARQGVPAGVPAGAP